MYYIRIDIDFLAIKYTHSAYSNNCVIKTLSNFGQDRAAAEAGGSPATVSNLRRGTLPWWSPRFIIVAGL